MSIRSTGQGPEIPKTIDHVAQDLDAKNHNGFKGRNIEDVNWLTAGLARLVGLTFTYGGKTVFLDKNTRAEVKNFLKANGHEVGRTELVSQALKDFVSSKVQTAFRDENIEMTKSQLEQALNKFNIKKPSDVESIKEKLGVGVKVDQFTISRDDFLKALKPYENQIRSTDKRYKQFATQLKKEVHNFVEISRPGQKIDIRTVVKKVPEVREGTVGEVVRQHPQAKVINVPKTKFIPEVREGEVGRAERITERAVLREPKEPTLAQKLQQHKEDFAAARAAFLDASKDINRLKKEIEEIGGEKKRMLPEVMLPKDARKGVVDIGRLFQGVKEALDTYRELVKGGDDKKTFDADYKAIAADYQKLEKAAKFHMGELRKVYIQTSAIEEEVGHTFEEVALPRNVQTAETVEAARGQRAAQRELPIDFDRVEERVRVAEESMGNGFNALVSLLKTKKQIEQSTILKIVSDFDAHKAMPDEVANKLEEVESSVLKAYGQLEEKIPSDIARALNRANERLTELKEARAERLVTEPRRQALRAEHAAPKLSKREAEGGAASVRRFRAKPAAAKQEVSGAQETRELEKQERKAAIRNQVVRHYDKINEMIKPHNEKLIASLGKRLGTWSDDNKILEDLRDLELSDIDGDELVNIINAFADIVEKGIEQLSGGKGPYDSIRMEIRMMRQAVDQYRKT